MGYSREIYDRAMETITQRHNRAIAQCDAQKAAFYTQCPRAQELETALAANGVAAAKAVLSGAGAKEQLTALCEKNLALQQEQAALLQQAGLTENALEPQFSCSACSDTGFIDGKMCTCLKHLMREQAYRQLNDAAPLSDCTFDNFSLHYYSGDDTAYTRMEKILRLCKNYAADFSLQSPNLLMQGGTGLGKTHLSLAIAHYAIEKGFGVIYCSAQNMVSNLEKERFGTDKTGADTSAMLIQCDLLIIDDLGTEFSTSFVTSAVYYIINSRLTAHRPTIISTNLSMQELENRYTERFASRLLGSYVPLFFLGKDIRQKKRNN